MPTSSTHWSCEQLHLPRVVPAFSVQALQHNVKIQDPPRLHCARPRPLIKKTQFRKYYERGDFPIALQFDASHKSIAWEEPVETLDYHHFLPMFFDGLCETEHPYKFFARRGIHDMIKKAPQKVLPVVPQLIIPIKNALNTRIPDVVCCTMKIIQKMVKSCDMVGEALVPYYRQILPMFNLLKPMNVNTGDGIDYAQQRDENIGDLVQQTLEILEIHGGEDAFINIKSHKIYCSRNKGTERDEAHHHQKLILVDTIVRKKNFTSDAEFEKRIITSNNIVQDDSDVGYEWFWRKGMITTTDLENLINVGI